MAEFAVLLFITCCAVALGYLGGLLAAWVRDLRRIAPDSADVRDLRGAYPNVQLWARRLRGDAPDVVGAIRTLAFALVVIAAVVAVIAGFVWGASSVYDTLREAPDWALLMFVFLLIATLRR